MRPSSPRRARTRWDARTNHTGAGETRPHLHGVEMTPEEIKRAIRAGIKAHEKAKKMGLINPFQELEIFKCEPIKQEEMN